VIISVLEGAVEIILLNELSLITTDLPERSIISLFLSRLQPVIKSVIKTINKKQNKNREFLMLHLSDKFIKPLSRRKEA